MSNSQELQQIELLARVDDLVDRLAVWCGTDSGWQPLEQCRRILRRVLERVETLRVRMEAPLIVATFGGTGTGKSSLVNALVGEECTPSGKQRPTTRRPVLITHTQTELELLGLPLDDVDIVKREADLLRDIVLVDCPDPDSDEQEAAGSNLARLRSLLPHCDVLIYTSTQQKYRSARIVDELAEAAAGCRLIFVQTRADLDEDIRNDWKKQLRDQYEVPDLFFVDAPAALREQQAGQHPSGEVGRLIQLLMTQLAANERVRIRRVNVIDLLQAALARCRDIIEQQFPHMEELEVALATQRQTLSQKMAHRLKAELQGGRNLWERRLLSAVTDSWGFSPFSSILRLYNGLGALIASMTFFRARNTAQMALIGAVQGTRWLKSRREKKDLEESLQRANLLGLDDTLLREAELVIEGHLYAAGFSKSDLLQRDLNDLRLRAHDIEGEFLGDARGRIDEMITRLAAKNSRWYIRAWYELLFIAYLAFVLLRVGYNFFYESLIQNEELLSTDFYLPAALFFLLWSGLLVIALTRRLRRGLDSEIERLAEELIHVRLANGLFPDLEDACKTVRRARDELQTLIGEVKSINRSLTRTSDLGGMRAAAAPLHRSPVRQSS